MMDTRRRTTAVTALGTAVTVGMFAVSCAGTAGADDWLADYGLDGMDAREIVEHLDTMEVADRPETLIASVEPETLELFDDRQNETSLPLPDDEFYVSFAPYREQTHDCYFHSLTTCLGEMSDEDIHVTVTDTGTDDVVIDETMRTYDNGFAGVWLPRDITATLTVEQDRDSATVPISTDDDAATCITTVQMT